MDFYKFIKKNSFLLLAILLLTSVFLYWRFFIFGTNVDVVIPNTSLVFEYGELLSFNKLEYIKAKNIHFNRNDLQKSKKDVILSVNIDYDDILIQQDKKFPEIGEYKISITSSNTEDAFRINFNGKNQEEIGITITDTTPPRFTSNPEIIETYREVELDILSYFSAEDLNMDKIELVNSNLDYSKDGEYPITIIARDKFDNISEWNSKLIVNKPTITLNNENITLYKGKSFKLSADIHGKENKAIFTSSNPDVAKVSEDGLIYANNGGSTIITATANGVSTECKVYVKEIKHFMTANGISDEYLLKAANELAYLPANAYNFFKNNGWTYYLVNGDMKGSDHFANISGTIYAVTYWDGTKKVYVSKNRISNSLLHELGHVVDCHLGRISSGEFSVIWEEERGNYKGTIPGATNHHVNDLREYFGDSFEAYLKWPGKLKSACPKTYEYMKNLILNL